jgi:hypothetical protein
MVAGTDSFAGALHMQKEIPDNKYFGSFFDDMHIREVDKTGEKIDIKCV